MKKERTVNGYWIDGPDKDGEIELDNDFDVLLWLTEDDVKRMLKRFEDAKSNPV